MRRWVGAVGSITVVAAVVGVGVDQAAARAESADSRWSGSTTVVVARGSTVSRMETPSLAAAITLMAVSASEPGTLAELDQFFDLLDTGIVPVSVASAFPVVGLTEPLTQRFRVAVVDTGVDPRFVPTSAGFDSIEGEPVEVPFDRHWHGTAVAEVLASPSAPGVAPHAEVVPVLACSDGCWMSHVAAGIDWSVSAGVDVINLSLGSTFRSGVLEQSINKALDAGVVVVAAAGSHGAPCSSGVRPPCGDPLMYPAAFPGVISVAALDTAGALASYTNRAGADIAAPGSMFDTEVSRSPVSGSSFAAPFVAATAGALRALHRYTPGADIAYGVVAAARDSDPIPILDIAAALRNGPEPPPAPPPTTTLPPLSPPPATTTPELSPPSPTSPTLPPRPTIAPRPPLTTSVPQPSSSLPSLSPPTPNRLPTVGIRRSPTTRPQVTLTLIPAGSKTVVTGFASSTLVAVEEVTARRTRTVAVLRVRNGGFRTVLTVAAGTVLRATASGVRSAPVTVPSPTTPR